MSDRRGVMLLMFDLPVKEARERRAYTAFRKAILRHGYMLFQKSVYIRLLRNISSAGNERAWVERQAPEHGRIHVMEMNLTAFRTLTAVRGEPFPMDVFADDVVFIGNPEGREWTDREMLEDEDEDANLAENG